MIACAKMASSPSFINCRKVRQCDKLATSRVDGKVMPCFMLRLLFTVTEAPAVFKRLHLCMLDWACLTREPPAILKTSNQAFTRGKAMILKKPI